MTIGTKLLLACLKGHDDKVLSEINKRWLEGDEIKQFTFLMDYYREHGELMGIRTFSHKFKLDIGEVDAKTSFYVEELKNRFIFTTLTYRVPIILKNLKESPKSGLTDLTELVSSLSTTSIDRSDTLYSDDVDKRKSSYTEREKALGVTYLSMGIKELDEIFYGYREHDLITIGGKAGSGKCLGKGTRVLMYDLSVKNVEDIVVGDQLMGPDGTPRNVLSISRGREQMYWVRQKKGMDYRVNESHILSLRFPREKNVRITEGGVRKHVRTETTWETHNVSVLDYLKKGYTFKHNAKGYKSYGMEFTDSSLPIDPYFLGVWLGDGTSRELTITSFDLPIIRFLQAYAKTLGGELSEEPSNKGLWRMKGCHQLRKVMDDYNLIDSRVTHKGFKHIPREFIKTSRKNRLALLAGLVDTDGYMGNNSFEITLVSKVLSDDIVLLCRTLGFYVSQSEKVIDGTIYYRCNIQGKGTDEVPVRLKRKKVKPRKQIKNVLHTGITLEKDIVDDYYGFTIDGDHLFCLEDFTVTHNTWLLCYLTHLLAKYLSDKGSSFGDILFVSNEMGEDEIKERFDCIRFHLPYKKFLQGTLSEREKSRYFKGLSDMTKSRIRILYNCYTLDDLVTQVGIYKPAIVFIDGSYLMEPNREEGWEKIVYLTRNLKRMAKNMRVPVINTTQLKRGSTKTSSKFALDGQDDFAYSSSYAQDSDIAIRMYQDADMKFHSVIGMEVVKGRRVESGTKLLFQNDLDNMNQSITKALEDEVPERKDDFGV